MTLFIPTKEKSGQDNRNITIAFRAIERWADSLQAAAAGITEITSADSSVTIVNPTGPTVDLHVAPATGGVYASLTGAGQTTTPGLLTQQGGFDIIDSTGHGHTVLATGTSGTHGGIYLETDTYGNVELVDNATAGNGRIHLNSQHNQILMEAHGAGGTFGTGTITLEATDGSNPQTVQLVSNGSASRGIFIGTSTLYDRVGFFGNTPISRPTVTGSRAGNAALASLMTTLATYGLVVDSTT